MKELNGLPEQLYYELVEIVGKEKAEEYLKKVKYNYYAVVNHILYLQILGFIKRSPINSFIIIIAIILLLFLLFL